MDEYVNGRRGTTKWQALLSAFDILKTALESTEDDTEQLGLASYSSGATSDCNMTTNYANVRSILRTKYPSGMTNITGGINAGLPIMAGARTDADVEKVFVVMTDGLHNQGVGPMSLVSTLNSLGYRVITITFGNGADQSGMAALAAACGGRHYHAPSAAELDTIFRNIGLGIDGLQYYQ
jgi:Mg-chelatase subunit ChlD